VLRLADMFCGGGLGARGAVSAGCLPVLATDIWSIATATYTDNFPSARVITAPVQDIDPLDYCPDGVDLLLTSPECTNHSPAKGAGPRSESSKRTALSSLTWTEALEPRWVVMENVPQIRNWSRYGELLAGFQALGYGVRETVVDSSDFGVPQARRRLFVTFEKGETPAEIRIPTRRLRRSVSTVLDSRGTWGTTALFAKGRAKPTLKRAKAAIDALGERASFLIVYYGTDGGGGWQTLDEPLRTITTLDRFALVERVKGEHRMRMLQPNELARAMGLPASHKFNHGTRRDKIKLCGNGICAPVMEEVIRQTIPEKFRVGRKAA
jgi:DNA (cytosine-5)-methyltransferase 1